MSPAVGLHANMDGDIAACPQIVAPGSPPLLLHFLRSLPSVHNRAPIMWITRSCKAQVATVLRERIQAAALTLAAHPGDMAAEEAQLLCKHAPQLLLHMLRTSDQAAADPRAAASCATVLKQRLLMAREGQWVRLAGDLLSRLREEADIERSNGDLAQQSAVGELNEHRAQQAVLKARSGNLRAAAAILIGGPAVPPGEQTDAQIQQLFHTSQPSDHDQRELREAIAVVDALPQRSKLKPTLRQVGRQAAAIRPAAGPGGSGWRNSYIQAVYADPDGPAALQAWSHAWAQGTPRSWAASIWTDTIARPFWKTGDCRKIRPVLCSEAMLKFAMGVCVRGAENQIQAAVGEDQFGAGRSAGAAMEVAQVRAAAEAFPDRVLISLDIQNAFGSVKWPKALLVLADKAPKLAVPIAAMWRSGLVRCFTKSPQGGWRHFAMHGSLVQGNVEAHPAFCIFIGDAEQEVVLQQRLKVWGRSSNHWLFVDDWTLQATMESAPATLAMVKASLEKRALSLQLQKCSFVIPELISVPTGDWPVQELSAHIQPSTNLTLLGTDACRDIATPMFHAVDIPPQARERLDRALQLSRKLNEVLDLVPPAAAKQPCFAMARQVVAHSLDYDACVLPCSVLLPHAGALDSAALDVVARTLDCRPGDLPEAACLQLTLPTRLSGMQVVLPSHIIPLARAARLMEDGPRLRQAIAAWELP